MQIRKAEKEKQLAQRRRMSIGDASAAGGGNKTSPFFNYNLLYGKVGPCLYPTSKNWVKQ